MFEVPLRTKQLIVIPWRYPARAGKQSVMEEIASLHFIPFAMTVYFF